ncbi:MAG: hypothetical protein IPP71_16710 [Bacteroidetes bacterium]|nr:hypothetical protein [Bacteroidota bacterium]
MISKIRKRFIPFLILFFIQVSFLYGQPYFDVAGLTGWYLPQNTNEQAPAESYVISFLSIPITLGSSNKIIFSPFQENRFLSFNGSENTLALRSIAVPITLLHSSKDSSWSFTATFIPRYNSEKFHLGNEFFQIGGAIISIFRLNPDFKLRIGLYYNKEFFGDYFIPLVGVDWIINNRLQLFGILPNVMKLEYKFTNLFYGGFQFKSITNSYRAEDGKGYYKLEDNHLGLYADFYISKRVVFMAEVGHTILRKFKNRSQTDFTNFKKDGPVFKAGIYYRLRFENR